MTRFQVFVVGLCCVINMLDGFDVLAIAFTGARIREEMGFDASVQGFLYGAGPLGMALGAFLISPLGDIIGRRKQVLLSMTVISLGMMVTYWARNPNELFVLRLLTGVGIGSMLASLNTVVAEFSNKRRRNFSLSIMHLGYGIGAGFGGIVTVYLLATFSGFDQPAWRYVFLVGGGMTFLMIPLVYLYLPESLEFILSKRPAAALKKINKLLQRLGQPPIDSLPDLDKTQTARKQSPLSTLTQNAASLFSDRQLGISTVSLWLITFNLSMVLYFVLSWSTQVLLDYGLAERNAIYAASLFSVVGAIGGLTLGNLSDKYGLRRLSMLFISAGAVSLATFGTAEVWAPAIGLPDGAMTLLLLTLIAITGFFVVGFVTAYFATGTRIYRASFRNTGLGVAVGVGRIGSAVGPVLAGLLIAAQWTRPALFLAFSVPLVVCLIAYTQIRGFEGE